MMKGVAGLVPGRRGTERQDASVEPVDLLDTQLPSWDNNVHDPVR